MVLIHGINDNITIPHLSYSGVYHTRHNGPHKRYTNVTFMGTPNPRISTQDRPDTITNPKVSCTLSTIQQIQNVITVQRNPIGNLCIQYYQNINRQKNTMGNISKT